MLQSPQGVKDKRNLQYFKPFNMLDQKEQGAPLKDGEPQIAQPIAEKEQETSLQDAEPWNATLIAEQPLRRSP